MYDLLAALLHVRDDDLLRVDARHLADERGIAGDFDLRRLDLHLAQSETLGQNVVENRMDADDLARQPARKLYGNLNRTREKLDIVDRLAVAVDRRQRHLQGEVVTISRKADVADDAVDLRHARLGALDDRGVRRLRNLAHGVACRRRTRDDEIDANRSPHDLVQGDRNGLRLRVDEFEALRQNGLDLDLVLA